MSIRNIRKYSLKKPREDSGRCIFYCTFSENSAINRRSYIYGVYIQMMTTCGIKTTEYIRSYEYQNRLKEIVDSIYMNYYDN